MSVNADRDDGRDGDGWISLTVQMHPVLVEWQATSADGIVVGDEDAHDGEAIRTGLVVGTCFVSAILAFLVDRCPLI